MKKRIKLEIEYDGTDFYGWQKQKNRRTVAGVLEQALSGILGQEIALHGSGRTDVGVHAVCQAAHFDCDTALPVKNIAAFANGRLSKDVKLLTSCEVAADFHARKDALSKTYEYKILLSDVENPLFRRTHYILKPPFDVGAARECLKYLIGRQDFSSFSYVDKKQKDTVRNIISTRLDWVDYNPVGVNNGCFDRIGGGVTGGDKNGAYRADLVANARNEIILEITGDGFLHNMVRIIAGTVVKIGKKKLTPADMQRIIKARDRQAAGITAPPQGLYLKKVEY
jgi:tRNA pseudouridine38-40 synthase